MVWNRTLRNVLRTRPLDEPIENFQHVWVNEKHILKQIEGRRQLILDCGCGRGRWGYLLHKKHDLIGIDVMKEYLLVSKRYEQTILGDVAYLPFKPKSFDTALAIELVEHLTKTRGYKFLKELKSVTKRIVLTTPKEYVQINFGDTHPETHRSSWNRDEILAIISS